LEDGWFEDLVGWLVGEVWLFGWFGILAPHQPINQFTIMMSSINQW
jgi:hypothetical protein